MLTYLFLVIIFSIVRCASQNFLSSAAGPAFRASSCAASSVCARWLRSRLLVGGTIGVFIVIAYRVLSARRRSWTSCEFTRGVEEACASSKSGVRSRDESVEVSRFRWFAEAACPSSTWSSASPSSSSRTFFERFRVCASGLLISRSRRTKARLEERLLARDEDEGRLSELVGRSRSGRRSGRGWGRFMSGARDAKSILRHLKAKWV